MEDIINNIQKSEYYEFNDLLERVGIDNLHNYINIYTKRFRSFLIYYVVHGNIKDKKS